VTGAASFTVGGAAVGAVVGGNVAVGALVGVEVGGTRVGVALFA